MQQLHIHRDMTVYSEVCASERERDAIIGNVKISMHALVRFQILLVLLASLQGVQYTCSIFLRLQCDHYILYIVRETVQVQYFQDVRRAGVACIVKRVSVQPAANRRDIPAGCLKNLFLTYS